MDHGRFFPENSGLLFGYPVEDRPGKQGKILW
jgi:hypothetical protein